MPVLANSSQRTRSGQITVMFVTGLITFLGMLSLTVDVGYYYATKAQLQAAADSALLTAFSRVRPYDSFDQQEQALKEGVAQFEQANLGRSGIMGVPPPADEQDHTHLFKITAMMDPSTKCLFRAEAQTVYTVPTNFARLFGQNTVDIGVFSAVEGTRVSKQGLNLMAGHLVE